MQKGKDLSKKARRLMVSSFLIIPTLLTPIMVSSCTVENTVNEELKNVKFNLLQLGKTKNPQDIQKEISVYGANNLGTMVVVGINEDLLFRYISKPKLGKNVTLKIINAKAMEASEINNGNPYLSISYTLSKGKYVSKIQTALLMWDGVEIPNDIDKEEVEGLVEVLKDEKIIPKININQTLASAINEENVWEYLDGELKKYTSLAGDELKAIIKSFNHNDDDGTLDISYIIKKNNYESLVQTTNTISGFKTSSQVQDEEEVNKLVEVLKKIQIKAKSNASEILPSSINSNNVWNYVESELQNYVSLDETKARVVIKNFNYNNQVGTLSIPYIVKKNKYESRLQTTNTINGFKTLGDL